MRDPLKKMSEMNVSVAQNKCDGLSDTIFCTLRDCKNSIICVRLRWSGVLQRGGDGSESLSLASEDLIYLHMNK